MELNTKLCMSALLFLSTLSGCMAFVPVNGESTAGNVLKSDTKAKVVLLAKAYADCNRIDSIRTEILEFKPIQSELLPAQTRPVRVDERWTVAACGKKVPVLVSFVPDGMGGTYYSVTVEKTEKEPVL
ncbi:MAG: hypothetical protein OQL28_15385 [Sedimenticola sp.]|nr:hypothetical protein [Sedimenticola sp.]